MSTQPHATLSHDSALTISAIDEIGPDQVESIADVQAAVEAVHHLHALQRASDAEHDVWLAELTLARATKARELTRHAAHLSNQLMGWINRQSADGESQLPLGDIALHLTTDE